MRTPILIRSVRASNVWLLRDGEGRAFLVDTGHRAERAALLRGLARHDVRRPGDLTAVLLTHRHSDHAGNAAFLRERLEVPVHAPAADAPFLEGRRAPSPLAHRGAPLLHDILCRIEDRAPARRSVDATFEEGELGLGFRALPVPGHTEGSTLLLHEASGILFTGDAVLAGPPLQRAFVRLRLARPEYSLEVERCREATLAHLGAMAPPRVLACGHGPLVARSVERHLRRLLERHHRAV